MKDEKDVYNFIVTQIRITLKLLSFIWTENLFKNGCHKFLSYTQN